MSKKIWWQWRGPSKNAPAPLKSLPFLRWAVRERRGVVHGPNYPLALFDLAATGRRFEIRNAIIWPLTDATGTKLGEAATFRDVRPL